MFVPFQGHKLIKQHQPLKHLFPARDFAARPTEFQVHEHAKRVGVDVGNAFEFLGAPSEYTVDARVNGGQVRNGDVIDVEFDGAFVHALAGGDFYKAGLVETVNENLDVVDLGGREEIVIGNGILGVIEFVLLRQVGVNRLASVAYSVFAP